MNNREVLEKTFDTARFLNGGDLNPTQQSQFVVLVKRFSTLLSQVRFVNMPTSQYTVDKMHISEPVTRAIAENTQNTTYSTGRFNQIMLTASKLISAWNITTEVLQSNIEQDGFEDTLFTAMTERIATDMEMLAVQGDVATYTGATDPIGLLLVRLNGWGLLSDAAHIVDADAATIDKNIFAAAIRQMPKQFRSDPGLRWIMSDTLAVDWMNLLAERGTGVGDAALQGVGLNPFGKPTLQVPLIPDDLAVTITAASPAFHTGLRSGPFDVVTGSNDTFQIVRGANTASVVIPAGTWDTVVVCAVINQALAAALPAPITNVVARDDGDGQILIETTDTGAAATFTLVAGATNFLPTGGLTAAVYTGVAAAGGGTVPEGTFLWLTNPLNLIFGMLDGTRVYSEFAKDWDRIETVVYNQVAVAIENIDALVKVTNIRRQTL